MVTSSLHHLPLAVHTDVYTEAWLSSWITPCALHIALFGHRLTLDLWSLVICNDRWHAVRVKEVITWSSSVSLRWQLALFADRSLQMTVSSWKLIDWLVDRILIIATRYLVFSLTGACLPLMTTRYLVFSLPSLGLPLRTTHYLVFSFLGFS